MITKKQDIPALEIKHLNKSFSGTLILEDISLTAYEGNVLALLGQSGSGKSTILRCINLLTIPDSGEINICGEKITLIKKRDGRLVPESNQQVQRLRSQVSMVFQQFNLWAHLTVIQNVIEAPIHVLNRPKDEMVAEAERLLKKVGLYERRNHFPRQLSGGQQQRAAIARALAMDPKVILFDEPTSALDPEMVNEVLSVMRQLAQEGKTMLVATHEMDFAREVATHVLFLEQGRIAAQGTPDYMFNHCEYERFRQFISKIGGKG